jgi:hypothetical protein
MLNLVNQLFKIYLKVNKLHLCKPLIRKVCGGRKNYHRRDWLLDININYRICYTVLGIED